MKAILYDFLLRSVSLSVQYFSENNQELFESGLVKPDTRTGGKSLSDLSILV